MDYEVFASLFKHNKLEDTLVTWSPSKRVQDPSPDRKNVQHIDYLVTDSACKY